MGRLITWVEWSTDHMSMGGVGWAERMAITPGVPYEGKTAVGHADRKDCKPALVLPIPHGCVLVHYAYCSMSTPLYILLTTTGSCAVRRFVIQAVALSAMGLGKACPTPSNKTSSKVMAKSSCVSTTCLRTLRNGSPAA